MKKSINVTPYGDSLIPARRTSCSLNNTHFFKWLFILAIGILSFTNSFAQVGISSTSITPDVSSILELRSTTSGFLLPRMTTAQRDAIASPATGLVVYNSTTNQLNYYTGSSWQLVSAGSSGTVTSTSVTTANGFSGTVATSSTTPAITISTSVNGIAKGNGTALSAATSGTDYSAGTSGLATGILKSTTTTGALSIANASDFPTLNQNTTGTSSTITGSITESQVTNLTTDLAAKATDNLVVHLAGTETIAGAKTYTADQIFSGNIILSGNQTAPSWNTSGLRLRSVPATLKDNTSSGTVAVAHTYKFSGDNIAATNATTFTDYNTAKFTAPIASTNVTITNPWAIFTDNIKVGLSNPVQISTAGILTATNANLTTPALGTPSAIVLTNATGLPLSTAVTGTLAASQFPALTGDITTTAGALATTLATVNSNLGTFNSVTVNAKGLVTAASNTTTELTGKTNGDVNSTYPDNATYWSNATTTNGFPVNGNLSGIRKGIINTQRVQDQLNGSTYARSWINGTTSWTAWAIYLDANDFTAKGDMHIATANNSVGVLGVGTDGQVLQADATQTTGVKWVNSGMMMLTGNSNNTSINNSSLFFPVMGGLAGNATDAQAGLRTLVSRTGTVRNLYVKISVALPAGKTGTVTLYKNGVATAMVATLTAGQTSFSDLINAISVSAGDEIEIYVSTTGNVKFSWAMDLTF